EQAIQPILELPVDEADGPFELALLVYGDDLVLEHIKEKGNDVAALLIGVVFSLQVLESGNKGFVLTGFRTQFLGLGILALAVGGSDQSFVSSHESLSAT